MYFSLSSSCHRCPLSRGTPGLGGAQVTRLGRPGELFYWQILMFYCQICAMNCTKWLLGERTPARTWSFGFPMQNRSHQGGTDRPWELPGVKGRKETLGKAAEKKEEKHSGGNSSGGMEDKPQHWEKLLWMVQGAVIQCWGEHPSGVSWTEARVSQAAHRAGL